MQTLLIKDLPLSEEMDSTARAAVRGGGISMMNNSVVATLLTAPPIGKGKPVGGSIGGSIGSGGGDGEGGTYDTSGGGGWLDGSYLDGGDHRPD